MPLGDLPTGKHGTPEWMDPSQKKTMTTVMLSVLFLQRKTGKKIKRKKRGKNVREKIEK